MRSALGASRQRIVTQLFVEALLLAGVAAAAGIGLVSIAFTYLEAALRQFVGVMPFWMTFRLSTEGVIYVVALTLAAAAIVGAVPAIKATGRRVQAGCRVVGGERGADADGPAVDAAIVVQVALTVAMLPAAIFHAWESLRFRTGDRGFATKDFLSTQLSSIAHPMSAPPPGPTSLRRAYALRQAELEQRLEAEPRYQLSRTRWRTPAKSSRPCSRSKACRRQSTLSTTTSSKGANTAIGAIQPCRARFLRRPSTCRCNGPRLCSRAIAASS